MHVDILKYLTNRKFGKENNYDKDGLCFFPCGIFFVFHIISHIWGTLQN